MTTNENMFDGPYQKQRTNEKPKHDRSLRVALLLIALHEQLLFRQHQSLVDLANNREWAGMESPKSKESLQ